MTDEIVLKAQHVYDHEPDEKITYDVIIIGGGVTGLSASMYAARLGLKTLVIGEMMGGTIMLTEKIENYPGIVSVNGPKLAELIESHAMDYDTHILTDIVENVFRRGRFFEVKTDAKKFKSKTVVLATGTKFKKLGIPGEDRFLGRGVSYCAICDATSTKNKITCVIGGGDSAVKEANMLTRHAKKVFMINNEQKIHAEMPNMKKMEEHIKSGKIEVFNNTEAREIAGEARIEKIIFKKPSGGKKEIFVDWVFIYIGHSPKSDIARKIGAKVNAKGEVAINQKSETSVRGFYAAGDVTNTEWKQAIIGVSQGVTAAYYAYEYIYDNFG